jgi:RNA recognition motif-containing protein
MAKRLFVGGLPWTTTEDELKTLFAAHGAVASVKIITDKYSGRSKGFGFVEFETDEQGDAAVKALNGTELGGRKIVVNEARPMEERRPRE